MASLSDGLVSATLEVYGKVEREMLPTPSRPHYTFNLRDISKVVQASGFRTLWMQARGLRGVAGVGKPILNAHYQNTCALLTKCVPLAFACGMCLTFLLLNLYLELLFVLSQGILLVKHQSIQAPAGMVRLWMHEMSRVFGDRLADPPHRVMFEHMLIEAVGRSVPALDVFFSADLICRSGSRAKR